MLTIHNQTLKQMGLSLLELMIAMAIAAVISAMIVTFYLSMQKNMAKLMAVNTLQYHAQKAQYILSELFARAGVLSCQRFNNSVSVVNNELTIRYTHDPISVLSKPSAHSSVLLLDKRQRVTRGDILIVSDCMHAEMLRVKTVEIKANEQKVTIEHPMQYNYETNAEIGRYMVARFFVKTTKRLYKDGTPIKALYMSTQYRTEELIEGVESMKIVYFKFSVRILLYLKAEQYRASYQYFFSLREHNV